MNGMFPPDIYRMQLVYRSNWNAQDFTQCNSGNIFIIIVETLLFPSHYVCYNSVCCKVAPRLSLRL